MDKVPGLLSSVPAPGCLIWYSKCPLIILELEGERDGENEGKWGGGFILAARRLRALVPFIAFFYFCGNTFCRLDCLPPVTERGKVLETLDWSPRSHKIPFHK